MGAQSSTPPSPKLTLAEKRYRVNAVDRFEGLGLRRKSTRKMGNVTQSGANLEVSHSVRSFDAMDALNDGGSSPPVLTVTSGTGRSASGGEIDARLFTLYPEQFDAARRQPPALCPDGAGGVGEGSARQHAVSTPTPFCRANGAAGGDAANQILITRTQRVLIENSWKRCRKTGSDSVGSRIFISVLTAQPDIKLLFGLEKIPQGRLKYDPGFRKHASVLTRTLDYIVKNLVYTDKLSQHFQALGKKHCQLPGKARIQDQYWDAFAEAFTVAVVEGGGDASGHRCRETSSAWRCLIAFIMKQMRRGYDDERNVRKRFSASLMGAPLASSAAHGAIRANSTVAAIGGTPSGPARTPAAGEPGRLSKARNSLRKLSDYRVASLSAIPTPMATIPAAEERTSLSLTASRAPSLSGGRTRTPSINSAAPAAGDEKASLLSPHGQPQQRSASWCSDRRPFDDAQLHHQQALNALARAMRQQAVLNGSNGLPPAHGDESPPPPPPGAPRLRARRAPLPQLSLTLATTSANDNGAPPSERQAKSAVQFFLSAGGEDEPPFFTPPGSARAVLGGGAHFSAPVLLPPPASAYATPLSLTPQPGAVEEHALRNSYSANLSDTSH